MNNDDMIKIHKSTIKTIMNCINKGNEIIAHAMELQEHIANAPRITNSNGDVYVLFERKDNKPIKIRSNKNDVRQSNDQ